MTVRLEKPEAAGKLFEGWDKPMIWSVLQNMMGAVYADRQEAPVSALAVLGDFGFLAGKPSEELISYAKHCAAHGFFILVPQNEAWAGLIAGLLGEQAKEVTRYAIKKEKDIFDIEHLKRAASTLPEGFELKPIGDELYHACKTNGWSRDLVSQFADSRAYKRLGIGMAVVRGGELAAGASSYARFTGGIEIEIDTKEEFRRRGLAYACGAGLILRCLEQGLYPGWDAQNPWSAALAVKLGYHLDYEYKAYECQWEQA